MGNKKFILILFMLIFLFACEDKTSENDLQYFSSIASDTIKTAKVITYLQLKEGIRASLCKYGCSYYTDNWNRPHRFDEKKSYYLRILVDPEKLGQLTFRYSCGTISSKRCTDTELSNKMDYENPYMLYGKYKNRWVLFNGSDRIPDTQKFKGFSIIDLQESGGLHEMILGPIPLKPNRVEIKLSNNITQDGLRIPYPSKTF